MRSAAPALQQAAKFHEPATMISLQVFYEGNVQGVGFRLPDGRVELQVTGEQNEVRTFLDHIARGELHALIHKQTEQKLEKPVTSRGFDIRHD